MQIHNIYTKGGSFLIKKVIMTGATGFIGYHLLRYLLDKNIKIWVILREDSQEIEMLQKIPNINVIICSLDNISQIDDICDERYFDVFFHLAWEGASGELRLQYKLQMDNAKWTAGCVEAAKKLGCKKIVVTGTVCEKQMDEIVHNKTFVRASNYLLAKDFARTMSFNMSKFFDIPLIWCQFYHPIGVFNKKNQLITNTVEKMLKNETLVFGSCESLFDIINVNDLVYGMYLLADKVKISNTYYIGSGDIRRLKDYLLSIAEIIGTKSKITFGDTTKDDLLIDEDWLSLYRIQRDTGYEPHWNFENSILELTAWLSDEDKYNLERWNLNASGGVCDT